MAAFDLNAFYAIQKPKTSSFEEINDQFGAGFDLGRRVREQQDRNSVKALIAQRESEGVPYDTLSNEVAKYDPNLANAMRDERRTSINFNYRQGVAEFEQWRKNMARRIAGRILQKADEMGLPQENLDQYLELAAKYVITYDPELAQWLLQQGAMRSYNRGRLNNRTAGKPITDGENRIRSIIDMADKATADGLSDPEAMKNRAKDKEAGDRLMAWKNANPYDFYTNPNGRLIYPRMITVIRNASGDNPMSLSDEEVTRIVSGITDEPAPQEPAAATEPSNGQTAPAVTGPRKPATAAKPAAVKEDNYGLRPIAVTDRWTKAKILDPIALGELSEFVEGLDIEDPDLKEKYSKARRVAVEGGVIKDMDTKQSLKLVTDALDAKKKEYDGYIAELKELGIKNPEEAFKKFKNLFGQRASMGTVIQLRNFNAFLNSYISNAPVTAISNGLLVGTPTYKPTLAEINAAKNVHGNWGQAVKTVLMNSRLPFASQVASYANEYDALQALGQDVEKQARDIWRSVSKDLPPDEYASLKKLYTDLFHIGPNAWAILEDPNVHFPTGEEYDRQLAKMNKANGKGRSVDLSGTDESGANGSGGVDALFEGL